MDFKVQYLLYVVWINLYLIQLRVLQFSLLLKARAQELQQELQQELLLHQFLKVQRIYSLEKLEKKVD